MSVADDVKARLDIVEVISGYVTLQKAGRNYKALCPFHQERTPSFVVFPETQTWRCFGACGEGGDIFGFVMKAEGWDFGEALHQLAKRAGVTLSAPTREQVEQDAQAERLFGLLGEAAHFFFGRLIAAPDAQIARDYVAQRGLNGQTVETFQIGYAPDDWHQALHHLQMLGYSQDEILEAGIAIRSDKGTVYDRFRHRLMIPIRDERGRTVGFGARALDKDANPKYLNSPQGPLFDKSRLLFGLDMARRAIREAETAVVVEGYMDVIQAHQAGFRNVVAQMGTALTEHQLRQLDKYAARLILALDPDTAGVNATMRGLDVARQTFDGEQAITFDPRGVMRYTGLLNMDIRIVSLPAGQDPDDLIREDPVAWQSLIETAIPVADYVIEQGTGHLPERASFQEREAAARALLPILTATESDLQRNVNIQALARRVRIDERTLIQWTQIRRVSTVRTAPSLAEQRCLAGRSERPTWVSGPLGQSVAREDFCLRLLIQQPERLYIINRKLRELQGRASTLAEVLAPLSAEDFSRPDYQAVFNHILDALDQDDQDPLDYLEQALEPELREVVSELRVHPLDTFQQTLSSVSATELRSFLREWERIESLPPLSNELFVAEALALRQSRLERESQELYFLQQDAQGVGNHLTDQAYQAKVSANAQARRLISAAREQLKSFERNR